MWPDLKSRKNFLESHGSSGDWPSHFFECPRSAEAWSVSGNAKCKVQNAKCQTAANRLKPEFVQLIFQRARSAAAFVRSTTSSFFLRGSSSRLHAASFRAGRKEHGKILLRRQDLPFIICNNYIPTPSWSSCLLDRRRWS